MKNENLINSYISVEVEPKRTNRFTVELPSELNIESYLISKVDRPSLSNGKWNSIKITFLDMIVDSPAEKLIPFYDELNYNKAQDFSYMHFISIKDLDPVGVEVGKWIISFNEIANIDFGNNSYGIDGIQTCSLTIQPKNCIYHQTINLTKPSC